MNSRSERPWGWWIKVLKKRRPMRVGRGEKERVAGDEHALGKQQIQDHRTLRFLNFFTYDLTFYCRSSWNKTYYYEFFWQCLQMVTNTYSVQFSSVAQSCLTLQPHELQHARPPCASPTPRVHPNSCHRVGDAIQPSHPLLSPSPPAPNPSQHQGVFQGVNSSHQVAKVLEFQLQRQSYQWTLRTDLL